VIEFAKVSKFNFVFELIVLCIVSTDAMASSVMQAFLSLANNLSENVAGQNIEVAVSIPSKTTILKQTKATKVHKQGQDEGGSDPTDSTQPKKTIPDYFFKPFDTGKTAHVDKQPTEQPKPVDVSRPTPVKAVATSMWDPAFDINNDELESFLCCEGNLPHLDKADIRVMIRDSIQDGIKNTIVLKYLDRVLFLTA